MAADSTVNAQCVTFSENTSLHGLKNVGGSVGKIYRRCIWLFLMLSMLGLLLFYFIMGLTRYLSYPTVTKINIFQNESLFFPIVTICNNNMIRSTYMAENPLVANVTAANAPFMEVAPTMDLTDPLVIQEMTEIIYSDMIFEGGHQINTAFEYCYWNDEPFNCLEDFVTLMTDDYGLCYTFNKNQSLIAQSPGNIYGLEVAINVEEYLYSEVASSPGAGIRVVIHENVFPPLDESAILLAPGVTSELAIFRKEQKMLPFPYEGPGCHDGDEYKFLTDCQILCILEFTVSKCQCQIIPLPDPWKGFRNCSLYDYHVCITPGFDEYLLDQNRIADCGCLHNCHEVSFDVKQSYMLYSSGGAVDYDYIGSDDTEYTDRNNIVHLKIYYGDFVTTITEQVGSYTFANFSAEVGGYLGLCVGASMLTLTELLEFLLTLTYTCLCPRGNKTTMKEIHSK